MISRDVVILIYSRGREECLERLVHDLSSSFMPPLKAAGLSCCLCVYAQGYSQGYRDGIAARFAQGLSADELVVVASDARHRAIGEVAHAAIGIMHDLIDYKLAMLVDDDSLYRADPVVDANLQQAASAFIARGRRAYSIKLGAGDELRYEPFVESPSPIMPFKEKMLWVSRDVLAEILVTPRFPELSVGEDAVIAAVAWLGGPGSCFGVHGMGSFFHLAFERPAGFGSNELDGGYAELTGRRRDAPGSKYDAALRNGVTPYHIMPNVFVAEDHEHYEYNGVQAHLATALEHGSQPGPG